jgi:hypothetical protein
MYRWYNSPKNAMSPVALYRPTSSASPSALGMFLMKDNEMKLHQFNFFAFV